LANGVSIYHHDNCSALEAPTVETTFKLMSHEFVYQNHTLTTTHYLLIVSLWTDKRDSYKKHPPFLSEVVFGLLL